MSIDLKIGIANRGVLHHNNEQPVNLEDWFKEVSQSNVFDYIDKTPSNEDFDEYKRLAEKYKMPILCGGWFYQLGKDDDLILENLKTGSSLGNKYHKHTFPLVNLPQLFGVFRPNHYHLKNTLSQKYYL